MDKAPKIGKKFHPQTPIWVEKHPFSQWPPPVDRDRKLFKSCLNGERLVV